MSLIIQFELYKLFFMVQISINNLKCIICLQVEYKDFPKNNKNEFVSLINCSSQPPLISHGIGKDVESCHDMVSIYFRNDRFNTH